MSYSARDIEVLPPLEAVRRRPSMYVGSTGPQGIMQLFVEVAQNAIDEVLAGHATQVDVVIDGSRCTITDNGRGIPVDLHPQLGRPALELVVTELHAGGKFLGRAYAAPGGLHGVGLSCVNALSETLFVEVLRDGHRYRLDCARGKHQPIHDLGPATGTGTTVSYQPDPQIFVDSTTLDTQWVATWLEEQAFLGAGCTLSLQAQGEKRQWKEDGGLPAFVRHLSRELPPIHAAPIYLQGQYEGISVEAALQWTTNYGEEVRSFVNRVRTPLGGTHAEGLGSALSRVLHREASRLGLLQSDEELSAADLREGLVGVLSIRMLEPEFEGQTKSLLSSSTATTAVESVIIQAFSAFIAAEPETARAIVGKALEAGRARRAARRANERARYRSLEGVISKEVYRQQFGIRSRNWHQSARWLTDSALLGSHAAMCAVAPDAQVLDVCCGSGVVGASFRGKVGKITGLDLTPEMVRLASERLDEVIQGDVYAIPFPEARFDLVVNREVLHLLPEPQRPVAEIFRVLKPGGQFIVGQMMPYSDADAAWFFRVVKKKQPLFFNNLMEDDMMRLLEGAGFTNITTTEYLQWEDIEVWINTWETPNHLRHEIRDLYHHAPAEARAVHPFRIEPDGRILDQWRWVVFSAFKPVTP